MSSYSRFRSQLVFGAALALVVSLSGVRSVAAEAEAPAVDLVLEPLAAPQDGFQLPGLGGGRFGDGGSDPFEGSLFGDLASFFSKLRFGSSNGGGGDSGGGGGVFTPRPGDASNLFPGRFR